MPEEIRSETATRTAAEAQEALEVGQALTLFEAHPEYAGAQVRMRKQMAKADRNAPAFGTFTRKSHLEYVLTKFDIRAAAFLGLVSDMQRHKAFVVLLRFFERIAKTEFSGHPDSRPASAESYAMHDAILARAPSWTLKSFVRLRYYTKQDKAGARGRGEPKFPKRALWLKARLLERGWSNTAPREHGGPDRKTIEKVLGGYEVRTGVLEGLAEALSKKHGLVSVFDIPEA